MDQNKICKEGLDHTCGRLCSQGSWGHLMTRLAVVEGSVLELLESQRIATVHELMDRFEIEPCAIAMAVGSLVRQGILRSWEGKYDVFVEYQGKVTSDV